tara:strand:- start:702 stop:905 length:204 start_codon:yes stop_codon:yes gene_type:complete
MAQALYRLYRHGGLMNKANKILHNFFSNDVVLIMKKKQKNPTLSNKDAIDILKTLSIDELVEEVSDE